MRDDDIFSYDKRYDNSTPQEKDFDPLALAEQAIEADLDPSAFAEVDDRDMPKAGNFLSFMTEDRFMKVKSIFPRQIEVGINLLGQFCPRCTNPKYVEEREDRKYLALAVDTPIAEIRSNVVLLEFGVCPKCGVNRLELIKNNELMHHVEMAICAGMRCVAGDTFLATDRGLVEIQDLAKTSPREFSPLEVRVSGPRGNVHTSDHYFYGEAPTLILETEFGLQLQCSEIHPVLALNARGLLEYIQAKDLKEGDYVLAVAGSDLWGSEVTCPQLDYSFSSAKKDVHLPEKLTVDLARFLGYLVADGTYSYSETGVVKMFVSCSQMRDDYVKLVRNLFNVEVSSYRGTLEEGDNMETLEFCSREVRLFLKELGLEYVTYRDKSVPSCILKAPKDIVLAFIGGLYDGDGGCYSDTIHLTTTSVRLARQVQALLLNLGLFTGITSGVSRKFNSQERFEDGRLSHTVFIRSLDGVRRFCELVPFTEGGKKVQALANLELKKQVHTTCVGTRQAASRLLRKQFSSSSAAQRAGYYLQYRNQSDLSYEKLADFLSQVQSGGEDLEHLKLLSDRNRRLLRVKKIREGGMAKVYDLHVPGNHEFLANGIASHNSGKSVTTAMLAAYQLHRYISIPSPARYFGLLPKQTLHMTFTALTATQAGESLWDPFRNLVEDSPWFSLYHEFLDQEGKRLDTKLYSWKETFYTYKTKSLVGTFVGANIRTLRGRTRFFTAIDEVGWFDAEAESGKVRENAYETHAALQKSLRTVRSAAVELMARGTIDPLDGLDCNISSPSAINDPIMTFIKQASTDTKKYVGHYSTWEFNPQVPLSSLTSEMGNRAVFDRDYGAVPALGTSPFIDNQPLIEKLQRKEPQNLVTWRTNTHSDEFGNTVYLEVECMRDKHRPRAICVDTGLSNNAFAVSVLSWDRQERRVDVDVVLSMEPERNSKGSVITPVNFPLMYEHCIVPLIDNLNVNCVLYDRWNSIDQIQRIQNEKKVKAEQISLKFQDFNLIRSRFYDAAVSIPRGEMSVDDVRRSPRPLKEAIRGKPGISLIMQILTVREIGNKITKPIGNDDDIFRSICLGIHRITDPKYSKEFENYGVLGRSSRSGGSLGVYRSNRGASTARSVSSSGTSSVGVRKKFDR